MHFEKAPVLIVALFRAAEAMASIFQADSQAHARMRNLELDGAKISTAMAVQNMILCAAEQGVGTCVMSGPLIASESMARVLAVPDGWDILCLVCAGYPDESPEPPRRKSVDQVVIPVGEPGGSDGV
jgi:nitroreductase